MTTYTVQAFALTYDDITDEPNSFAIVDYSFVLLGGSTFTYSIAQTIPNELPDVNISGAMNPRADGTLIDLDSSFFSIGVVTSLSGTHYVYVECPH